jgi:hypothetical protein
LFACSYFSDLSLFNDQIDNSEYDGVASSFHNMVGRRTHPLLPELKTCRTPVIPPIKYKPIFLKAVRDQQYVRLGARTYRASIRRRRGIAAAPIRGQFFGKRRRPTLCHRLEARYNHGYTTFVKTAISIPDSVFEEAERLAKTRGWSRSELYANAVTAYVNSERFSGVREKLDAVYGNDEEDSAIDPFLADAQARSLPREKW